MKTQTQPLNPQVTPASMTSLSDRFKAEIERLYLPENIMPYHNFPHAIDVRANALAIAKRASAAGHVIDMEALPLAALGHDALSFLPRNTLGFNSSELLSADVSRTVALRLGYPIEVANRIADIIPDTDIQVLPKSIEGRILRAADLIEVAGDYRKLVMNASSLYQEKKTLDASARDLTFKDFFLSQLRYLSFSMVPYFELTNSAKGPREESLWHHDALKNFITLFKKPNVLGEQACITGVLCNEYTLEHYYAENSTKEHDFVISVAHTESERMETLQSLRNKKGADSPDGVYFTVPGKPTLSPIPDQSCDLVFIDSTAALKEALRVLKADGSMYVRPDLQVSPNGFTKSENQDKLGWIRLDYTGKIKNEISIQGIRFVEAINFESDYPETELAVMQNKLLGAYNSKAGLLASLKRVAQQKAAINSDTEQVVINDDGYAYIHEYDWSFSEYEGRSYETEYLGCWEIKVEEKKIREADQN